MSASPDSATVRRAAGDHTVFLGDPMHEALFSMVVALLAELSVARDRLDAHERLLQAAGLPLGPGDVDGYDVTAEVAQQRAATRERMIRHVFRALYEKLPPAELRAQSDAYSRIFAEVQTDAAQPAR
ncbi:MAG: hypothetical protein R3E65_06230 [Steroidobacteraceae bacterium]